MAWVFMDVQGRGHGRGVRERGVDMQMCMGMHVDGWWRGCSCKWVVDMDVQGRGHGRGVGEVGKCR